MRGLTKAETEEYEGFRTRFDQENAEDTWSSVQDRHRDVRRFNELHNKHEIARIAAVAAEAELRIDKPIKN
jgi:hypothetical protein